MVLKKQKKQGPQQRLYFNLIEKRHIIYNLYKSCTSLKEKSSPLGIKTETISPECIYLCL